MGRKLMGAGLALLMILVLLIGIAGCGDDDGNGSADDITQAELIENAVAADDDIETARFDMQMSMDMSGKSMGQEISMDMIMAGNGAMDNLNQKMKMDMHMDIGADMGQLGDMEMEMDMETYLIDDVMYMKMGEMMGMPEGWMKMEVPGSWDEQDMIAQQIDLLESAELEISDGGKVNGESCYKVKMTPDMRELFESVMSQPGMGGEMGVGTLPEDMDISEFADMVKDFSVTQWYAKDTFFPMKAEIEMNMVMTAADMGMAGGDGSMDMDMSMTMNFKDYNKSVSIELPAEAEGAMDMSESMDMGGGTGW
ncbi:MAG: DUF6612 family protein [Dehalococcoidia bacterium]